MSKKSFDITGKKKHEENESAQKMDKFVSGSETQTTMTVQIPERLKLALKWDALTNHTTIKKRLILILESYFTNNK